MKRTIVVAILAALVLGIVVPVALAFPRETTVVDLSDGIWRESLTVDARTSSRAFINAMEDCWAVPIVAGEGMGRIFLQPDGLVSTAPWEAAQWVRVKFVTDVMDMSAKYTFAGRPSTLGTNLDQAAACVIIVTSNYTDQTYGATAKWRSLPIHNGRTSWKQPAERCWINVSGDYLCASKYVGAFALTVTPPSTGKTR